MAEGAVSQTRANPLNQFVTELYSDVRFENWVLLIDHFQSSDIYRRLKKVNQNTIDTNQ